MSAYRVLHTLLSFRSYTDGASCLVDYRSWICIDVQVEAIPERKRNIKAHSMMTACTQLQCGLKAPLMQRFASSSLVQSL